MAQNPVFTITMSDGREMKGELYPEFAPQSVGNFIALANSGFYNKGMKFFRVVSGTLIQAGDPHNDGTGDSGELIYGEFADNGFSGNTLSHDRGTISMARQSDYDSASSQFFIMHYSYPEYDGRYAAFGIMMDEQSFSTLDKIATQPVDGNYMPVAPQVIESIQVETYGKEYEAVTTPRKKDDD